MLSLIVGTIGGLTQYRIKRLFAYSTISHIGFILLALSISSIESGQGFVFYLIQYSICNLNIFIILIIMGLTMPSYKLKNIELIDKNNSPIQYIKQLRGYFNINPFFKYKFSYIHIFFYRYTTSHRIFCKTDGI